MMLHRQNRWEFWHRTARSCLSLKDEVHSPKFSASHRALNVKLFWSHSNASWIIEDKISLGFWKALLLNAVDLHLLLTGWIWTPVFLIAPLWCLMEEPRKLQKCPYWCVKGTTGWEPLSPRAETVACGAKQREILIVWRAKSSLAVVVTSPGRWNHKFWRLEEISSFPLFLPAVLLFQDCVHPAIISVSAWIFFVPCFMYKYAFITSNWMWPQHYVCLLTKTHYWEGTEINIRQNTQQAYSLNCCVIVACRKVVLLCRYWSCPTRDLFLNPLDLSFNIYLST